MIRAIVFLLALLLSPPVWAEPVRVSAGEQSGFTRVILEFPELPQWQARRRGTTYRINFSSVSPLDFDVSRVFRLVDRERIRDVRAVGGNALEIDLACNCDVSFSQTGSNAIVADVHPFEDEPPVAQASMSQSMTPSAVDETPDLPATERVVPAFSNPAEVRSPDLPEQPMRNADISFDLEASETTGQVSVELLGRALSRAAVQGLASAERSVAPRESETTFQQLRSLGTRQNLSVTTSFDRATMPDSVTLPPTNEGSQCLQDRTVDVAMWGDAKDSGLLGRLRSAAISEDGSIDAEGAADLARFYIHLGFGAEAQIAAKYMKPSQEQEIIFALAEVLDSGRSDAAILRGQSACQGTVSLWSILARPMEKSTTPISASPALAAFSALPAHLRTHLGPLLSERLHEVDLDDAARTAINAVTRGGAKTDESELATARLELDGTHGDEAREVLADLSNGTNLTAAAALLELLEDAESRGMAPNPAWVDDAPTLVGALEGNEVAEHLNVAGLRGKIALGRFDEFRAALIEDTPGLSTTSRKELANLALRKALEIASDQEFLKAEVGLAKILSPDHLAEDVRLALAARLHGLGLSQRGQKYLEPNPNTLEGLETTVDVLLAIGETREAIAFLESSTVEGIEDLRARLLVAIGDDVSAISAFQAAGDEDGAVSAAMRTADWTWIANNADPLVAIPAESLSARDLDTATATENQNGALIEFSRERRQGVRSLLELTRPSKDMSSFTN